MTNLRFFLKIVHEIWRVYAQAIYLDLFDEISYIWVVSSALFFRGLLTVAKNL